MPHLIPQERRTISSFDMQGVTLTSGPLRERYQQTRDYYYGIPNDDMLFGFRQRAGLPSPGKAMGGWYSGDDRGDWYSDGGHAHAFGQWLSAFARMAASNHDDDVREKALTLMHEWARTIDDDGYCAAISRSGHSGVGHYVYEKLCCGLVDIGHYLGDSDAPAILEKITGWASDNLGRTRLPAGVTNYSGQTAWGEGEWYTLSENLYRAYRLTDNSLYRDFAEVWHYTTFWNDLASGIDAFPDKHAYSHVNCLSGAAMAYAVTGETSYLTAITNGYDILDDHHLYATGGFGPRETFFPSGGYMSRSLWDNINWWDFPSNFETPCGAWAAFKIGGYLTQFTGSSTYGDWIERMVYNGSQAALPMAGYGKTFYYSDYKRTGACKTYNSNPWPCCSGTFPQATTEYHNLIYYRDDDGLYINLFVPSRVEWTHDGVPVIVTQKTEYPEAETITVQVEPDRAVRMALRFRVPGWATRSPSVHVNGSATTVAAEAGAWASVEREWQPGDTVQIRIPLELRFVPIEAAASHEVALTVGPVVLACDSAQQISGDREDPASWIAPLDEPLTYAVHGDPKQGLFRPFYRMAEGENYWMYKPVWDSDKKVRATP